MTKTSLGLEENVEALLCYLLGFVTGIVFFVLEKESKFVKFHAMQSIIVFLGIFVLQWVVAFIPFFGMMISWLIGLIAFVLWILLMVKAYQGERFKVPIAGDLAESYM